MATNGHPAEDTIALVGGGIGGLCAAIGFLEKKIPIHVYEAAPAFAEIGAGVSFGPNSVDALRRISPATLDALDKCVTGNGMEKYKNTYFTFRNAEDKSTKVGSPIIDLESTTGASSVHRAKLLDQLMVHVPNEICSFGKRLDNIIDNGDHVLIHFKDGTIARHSAVICCDGIKSRGRQILLGETHPAANAVFSGKYAYRGLIPMDEAASLLGDEIARNAQMFFAHGGHILTFPVEKGATMNVVAFGTAKEWTDERWVKEVGKAEMTRDFGANWVDCAHDIIKLMQKPDVWALFEFPDAPTYTKGLVCLLGDAAHASTPHQGAGAGMAIEDALIMSNLFEGVERTPQGIREVFEVYDQVRRPRTQRVVKTSREAGLCYDFMLEGVGDDLEKVKEDLAHRWDWIWYKDLGAHVEEAKSLLRERQTNGTK
ncbi:FAD-binding domain-containing protein 52 [Elsinoe fawcettii]|nr:FAD-binding domain-containing protein 52 [Elsinoe fawcettii]